LYGLTWWSQAGAQRTERAHFHDLSRHAEVMRAERSHLERRNGAIESEREFLAAVDAFRLPPVPQRFLAYSAALVPSDMRLTGFDVAWTDHGWRFSAAGAVSGNDDAARAELSGWQDRLAQAPWKVKFAAIDPASDASLPSHFQLEGGLLEN
jgi:hypothetical protein